MPVLTRFGDGRTGIIYRKSRKGIEFVDGTIDWNDERKTRSALFITRCVVVRTYHDSYLAVGEETVVNLGDLRPEIPTFGYRDTKRLHKRYGLGHLPALTIGEAWEPAIELAGDSSHVDFAHVDLEHSRGSGCAVRLDEQNYFDVAREILAQFEPDATAPRE